MNKLTAARFSPRGGEKVEYGFCRCRVVKVTANHVCLVDGDGIEATYPRPAHSRGKDTVPSVGDYVYLSMSANSLDKATEA